MADGRPEDRFRSDDACALYDHLIFRWDEFVRGQSFHGGNFQRVEAEIPEGLCSRDVLLAGRQHDSVARGTHSLQTHLERSYGPHLGQRPVLPEIVQRGKLRPRLQRVLSVCLTERDAHAVIQCQNYRDCNCVDELC